jgi:hypothetical protein
VALPPSRNRFNQLLIYGGVGGGEQTLTGLHLLHLDRHRWAEPLVSGEPPLLPRGTAVRLEDRILYAGSEPSVLAVLDVETWNWTHLPSPGPEKIFDASISLGQGRVLLFGGAYARAPVANLHMLELEIPAEVEDVGSADKSSTPPLEEDPTAGDCWEEDNEEISFEELLKREKQYLAARKAKQQQGEWKG